MRVLPHLLVLTARDWETPLVPLLAEEIVKDEPGQEAVLDRLLDLLLIAALRTWFARPDTPTPAWYRGYGDPVVGRALRLLQHQPARGGRSRRSPRRPGCRGRRWRAGSPSWSASRR